MAWESRKRGGRYYTRSQRQGGRVVRVYIGAGERGERAAAADALARDRFEREQAERQRERRQYEDADAQLAAWSADVDAQMRAALEAAGYHQHKRGEWRRKRGSTI